MNGQTGDLSLEELTEKANEFCLKHWGIRYTGEIQLVNRDWKRMRGSFNVNLDNPSHQIIRLSRKVNLRRSRDEVLSTLLHELVHWRLYNENIPCRDTDDEFIAECLRVGAHTSDAKVAKEAAERYLRKYNESEAGI